MDFKNLTDKESFSSPTFLISDNLGFKRSASFTNLPTVVNTTPQRYKSHRHIENMKLSQGTDTHACDPSTQAETGGFGVLAHRSGLTREPLSQTQKHKVYFLTILSENQSLSSNLTLKHSLAVLRSESAYLSKK